MVINVALLGIGLGKGAGTKEDPQRWVEYHRCDQCGTEYRVFFKRPETFKETLEFLAAKLGTNGKADLCFTCLSQATGTQTVLSMEGLEKTSES